MRKKQKIVNLYNDQLISNIKQIISIHSEDDLHIFWEFINTNYKSKYTQMNDFVSMFYEFAYNYILKNETHFFEIILEETPTDFYFTFWNKNISISFKTYLQKTTTKFVQEKNRISIKLDKSKQDAFSEKVVTRKQIEIKHRSAPYTFITDDDLEELLNLNEDMQEVMIYIYKNGFNNNIFISLRSSLSIFCLTLRYYDSISNIANAITEFSNTINTNKNMMLALDTEQLDLISGLINNIDMWIRVLFVEGGADLYFMDNSIKADCQMISQMFIPQCELSDLEEDLDDIFNF